MNRLETAVTKLYNAYHNNELDAYQCSACAVGNILGHGAWLLHVPCEDHFFASSHPYITNNCSGYSIIELMNVERLFLTEIVGSKQTKETQFNGLEAVVKYLCELEGVENFMDYTKLFETNEDKAIHELCFTDTI